MTQIKEVKAELEKTLQHYQGNADALDGIEARELTDKIKALRSQIVDAITDGAKDCPMCKTKPHGLEHTGRRGTPEYEIGCLTCEPFRHTDGTMREPRVRGGMMPKHAVDAWNAGPEMWLIVLSPADESMPQTKPEPQVEA